jgi:hypothetical protein
MVVKESAREKKERKKKLSEKGKWPTHNSFFSRSPR